MLEDFFFMVVWFWTQNLVLARRTLYHLSHAPSPFSFNYFQVGSCALFPLLVSNLNSPTSTYPVARITDMPPHLACLLGWGLTNFLPRLDSNNTPPYLCLLVATVIGMSHYTWLKNFSFLAVLRFELRALQVLYLCNCQPYMLEDF
jgi:hypothetical protein